jgi:hypothetical protein
MVESRIKTIKPTIKEGRKKKKEKEKVWRVCAPKQPLQFSEIFRTRFGGWLFVYP